MQSPGHPLAAVLCFQQIGLRVHPPLRPLGREARGAGAAHYCSKPRPLLCPPLSRQIAKWLGAPVLLVLDCWAMARSAAAVVKGFAEFDPDLNLAGASAEGGAPGGSWGRARAVTQGRRAWRGSSECTFWRGARCMLAAPTRA
jgi:hypothetical protein